MMLAEKIFWFKLDCGDIAYDLSLISKIASRVGTLDFLNETADYLLDIIADAKTRLKKMGDPEFLEGFEQIVYDDLIELHNRAVDLFNDMMEDENLQVEG